MSPGAANTVMLFNADVYGMFLHALTACEILINPLQAENVTHGNMFNIPNVLNLIDQPGLLSFAQNTCIINLLLGKSSNTKPIS